MRFGAPTPHAIVGVLDEMDFSDVLEQIELHQSIKCTCDGGGDAFRFVGAPPGFAGACPQRWLIEVGVGAEPPRRWAGVPRRSLKRGSVGMIF